LRQRNLDELLRFLLDKATAFDAPSGAFQVQALYEVTVRVLAVQQLVGRLEVGHVREQSGLVQWPAATSARRLHYGRQVGLGDVQARQPHHLANKRSRGTGEILRRSSNLYLFHAVFSAHLVREYAQACLFAILVAVYYVPNLLHCT